MFQVSFFGRIELIVSSPTELGVSGSTLIYINDSIFSTVSCSIISHDGTHSVVVFHKYTICIQCILRRINQFVFRRCFSIDVFFVWSLFICQFLMFISCNSAILLLLWLYPVPLWYWCYALFTYFHRVFVIWVTNGI